MAFHRNILILAIAQALGMAAAPIVILVGGLAGTELAPSSALSTLPIATLVVGAAVSSVPAAFLMKRVGRRNGFASGALIGVLAALLAARALSAGSFMLFCTATLLIGTNAAFVQQYRFAAAEAAGPAMSGRAVSAVMLGGIVAGFLGPELAHRTRTLLAVEYAGSFIALAALYLVLAGLLVTLADLQPLAQTTVAAKRRSMLTVARQPSFILAVFAGVVGYAVMSFIMTATPVSMRVIDQHPVEHAARVIQAHIIAMFTPALFSGFLVDRLGVRRMMSLGALAMLAAVLIGPINHEVATYTVALVLIGVGWNFLFVGSTVLLTRTYRPSERFAAQATNDFIVLGAQATAALTAGAALDRFGWVAINRFALPLVLAALAMAAFVRTAEPAPATVPAAD